MQCFFVSLRVSRLGKRSGDMGDFFWLSGVQIAKLYPFSPKSHGRLQVDDRRVLSGLIFVTRNRLRLRDSPAASGPHKTLYSHWMCWSKEGEHGRLIERTKGGMNTKLHAICDS